MNLRNKLFFGMALIFAIFSIVIWIYAHNITSTINEQWAKKFVTKQIMFDKYRTLLPILQEIQVVEKMAQEPTILAMARNENDATLVTAGLATLEKYRTLFQDRSYFAAFVASQNYYFNDSTNQFANDQLRYQLSDNKPDDKWFYETLKRNEICQINVNKDTILGVSKVWINYIIKDKGKAVGVIGTGFDFEQFLKHSVGIEQDGVRNFFITRDLSIQLAKETKMIDYASITKEDGTHKTIHSLIENSADISSIEQAMDKLMLANQESDVAMLWVTSNGTKQLLGISYQKDIGWFSLTFFDYGALTLIDTKHLFFIIIILFVAILVLLSFMQDRFILKPIGILIENMKLFQRGNSNFQHITTGGEFQQLADQFNTLTQTIQEHNELLEHKIAERTDDLLASEKKFRAIFDFTHDAVMLLDENGFIDCNKATLKIFGCKSVEEFCSFHPADLSPATQPCGTDSLILAQEYIYKAMVNGYAHFEWIHQRADSKENFYADVLLSAIDFGDRKILQAVVRDDSERKKAQQEIQTLAFYDTLTNLPNRRLLIERLQLAQSMSKRTHKFGAILFMDLDGFKPLNDEYGHSTGDILLIEVAHRIKTCIREVDTASRFGGDEFIVLIAELSTDRQSSIELGKMIADKIRQSIAYPYFLKVGNTLDEKIVQHNCSASIGMTLFYAHDNSHDMIFNQADSAMYQAKQEGKNKICIYE